ncbi:hypothetical protein P9847_01425 [Paenibacillus chibensis]|uniref:Uncharacterized protein n=1 Tax=Paenibacillus chibensis TaxID=59846 RepID=A0ABU6PM77_9BACL|nr:hypothetical protein [Paenibacillus chibensis]
MRNRKKAYTLHFVRSEDPVQSNAIIKSLAKQAIQKVLDKHGAVAHNLDEVLDKYIGLDPDVRKVDIMPPWSAESL